MQRIFLVATLFLSVLGLQSCGQIDVTQLKKPIVDEKQLGSATLLWDGSFSAPNVLDARVTGYRLHYGTATRDYTEAVDVGLKYEIRLENLPRTLLYFSVTAYDAFGAESEFSNEVSMDFTN